MQIDKSTGRLQKKMSLNSWFFFLMKKCINFASSTLNLYVLNIKLAQNAFSNLGGWF